jgi:hypothetical protein
MDFCVTVSNLATHDFLRMICLSVQWNLLMIQLQMNLTSVFLVFIYLDSLCKFQSLDSLATSYGKIFSISLDLVILVEALLSTPMDCDRLDIIYFLSRRSRASARQIILEFIFSLQREMQDGKRMMKGLCY